MKRICLALLVVVVTGCMKNVSVQRPADTTADVAVTRLWTQEIRQNARHGDWLLTRSYSTMGDVIVAVTPGESFSHASIYDARKGTVIESVGSGVREITLEQLVQRNHYVAVVRPTNMTTADQSLAVDRARSKVGLPFDIRGGIGFDNPDAWYCSELVFWASQTAARNGASERVVTPADLMKYGEVVYWSGKRDDDQVLKVAVGRSERAERPEVAAIRTQPE